MVYTVGMLLTTDQGFVNDVKRSIDKYAKRLVKDNPVVEDEVEETMALEFEKQVDEKVKKSSRKARNSK